MSIQRQINRAINRPYRRSPRNKRSAHIISRGVKQVVKQVDGKWFCRHQPIELHATKGWRTVRAWS